MGDPSYMPDPLGYRTDARANAAVTLAQFNGDHAAYEEALNRGGVGHRNLTLEGLYFGTNEAAITVSVGKAQCVLTYDVQQFYHNSSLSPHLYGPLEPAGRFFPASTATPYTILPFWFFSLCPLVRPGSLAVVSNILVAQRTEIVRSVECRLPRGAGRDNEVVLSRGGLANFLPNGTLPVTLDYLPPVITSTRPP